MKRRIQWLVIAVMVAAGLASFLFHTSAAPFAATLSAPFERSHGRGRHRVDAKLPILKALLSRARPPEAALDLL